MATANPTPTVDRTEHKYIRVTTANAETVVHSGGSSWAGVSEVPADKFSKAQLDELKADKRIEVQEIKRPHVLEA